MPFRKIKAKSLGRDSQRSQNKVQQIKATGNAVFPMAFCPFRMPVKIQRPTIFLIMTRASILTAIKRETLVSRPC